MLDHVELATDPLCRELVPVLLSPTAESSAGFPYLHKPAFLRLRDWVPHILGEGPKVLAALARIEGVAEGADPVELQSLRRALRVVRQVVNTAAVTAPPTLWLLRHVLSTFSELGLLDRLLSGEVLTPDGCPPLRGEEFRVDLNFLLGRGYVVRKGTGVRIAEHQTAVRVIRESQPLPPARPASLTGEWRAAFLNEDLSAEVRELLMDVAADPPATPGREPGRWTASLEDIEVGYRLVPLVLGLWSSGRLGALLGEGSVTAATLCPHDPELGRAVQQVLEAAGSVDSQGVWTSVGRRLVERGVGALGIIEAYHAYMQRLPEVLREGRGAVHVQRGSNITASQQANRKTFHAANDALDRFCEETGFGYHLYIEHAIGRGEATRQRYERSGDASTHYFGADLEDAAIDAAEAQRDAGELPSGMRFVRQADIGRPDALIEAIESTGVPTEGGVMVVGNGFHEIRGQSDDKMVEVFESYERAGLILLFTEENALSVDDLLETAWNTYHPGFRYVHERSGQGLRPATSPAPSTHGRPLPASWTECATRAGYLRAADYCSRSRTIYPYPTSNGHNPSISVNHFFVPARIARSLGLVEDEG
ncbi:MAG: hypothetical protein VX498_02970 [Myxococcota bacterium]|nr:hypothetical protein [Myxococcota bacterium]